MSTSSKRVLSGTFNEGNANIKNTDNKSTKRVLSGTISQDTSNDIQKATATKAIIDYEKTNRSKFYGHRQTVLNERANEINNIDVDALSNEIKDLEAKRDTAKPIYENYKVKLTGARGDQIEKVSNLRDSEIRNLTGDYTYDELNNLITEKKAQLVIADRNKRLKNLSSVINPESENYDKEFDKYKQIGQNIPWKEAGEMKGNVGSGLVTKTPYSDTAAAAWVMHSKNNPEAQKDFFDDLSNARKYEYLEPQEFDLLAYYLGKDKETGGKQAEEYLDLMEETLNQRMGKAIYDEKLKGNTALEILYGVPVGLDQFSSGVQNLLDTESDYIPASAIRNAGQLARTDLGDEGFRLPAWLGGSSIAQIGYDALSTTANMAPSILVSSAVGLINPTAGTWAGATLMGASSAGNAYQEALNSGMDKGQARVYSTLVGASEAAMSATVSKVFGGKVLSGKIETAISGIDKGLLRFAANYGWAFASEGLEEAAQEILTPLFENIALGHNKNSFEDIDWSEVAYSFLLGGLSGGAFDIIGSGVKRVTGIAQIKQDYNTPQKVQNLLKLALSMPTDSKANTLAQKYNTEVESKGKLAANKIYNLAIASENFINDRLIQLGEKNDTPAVASAVVKKLVGNKLSVSEMELLSKNSYGQEVLNTVVPASENSQNQQLQTDGEGDIINQGGEEDGRIYNQGAVGGSNETGIDTGRESQMGKSNETIDGYVSGGKGEILSGGTGETPRRIRINHTKNSSVTFTEGTADGTDGYKVYTAFANAGIKAIYCQGPIERMVNGVTVSRTEAFTAPDGTVYISSESTLPPKQTFDHEKVHVADKTNNPAYKSYVIVLCKNANYSSDTYKKVAETINKNQFNNKYDIKDKKTYPIFMREIAAYVNQFVLSDPEFAEKTFGGMFSDWGEVVEAVNKFNTDMGADFTESANFMPERENGGGVDLEITDNDMYAKDPSQWSAGNKNDTSVSKSFKEKLANLFGKNADKKTTSISEIVKLIEKDFEVPISKGKFRQKAYGIYKNKSQAIRTKVSNALPTIAHELGHHLDNKYHLRNFESINEAERVLKETRPDFYNSYKPEVRPREAVAEFMRDYLADREMAKEKYPFFFEEFERKLSEGGAESNTDLENLKMIGDKINEYYTSELKERAQAAILTRKEAKKINRMGQNIDDILLRAQTETLDDASIFKKISQKAYDLYYWAKKSNVRAKSTLTGYYMAGFNKDLVPYRDKNGKIITDENGKTAYVPALKFILSDIENNDMLKDFNEYLVMRHGVEWLGQDLRVFADDALNNKKYMTQRIAEIEKQNPQFKEISEKMYEWYRTFVYEYGVESGLMTKEQYKSLVEKYPCYVPFMRNVEGKRGISKSGLGNQNAPIKRAKGSGLEILDPIESIVIKVGQFMNAADRNAVMKEIADTSDTEGGFGWLLEEVPPDMVPNTLPSQLIKDKAKKTLMESGMDEGASDEFSHLIDVLIGESITDFKIGTIQGENVVAVRRNGKRTLYQIHDKNLLAALVGLQPNQFDIFTKMAGKITKLFKALTTGSNAVWSIVSNAPRDFDSAYKYGSENNIIKYTVDYFKAIASQIPGKQSETLKLYRTLGGGYNNSFANAKELELTAKELFKQNENFSDKIKSLFNIVENISKLADFVETAPRLAEFKRVYENTGDAKKAMLAAEEVTVNFNRSGKFSKVLDQYLPYFNASLQANAKYAKTIAHAFSKEGDKSFLVKSIVTAMIKAGITFGILGLFGDEGEEEYEKLSAYKKNNFYNIYLGNGKFLSIPKSQATGVFDSLLERTFEIARKEDVEWAQEVKDFANYMWLTFGPPLFDDIVVVGTALELAGNKDFTGAPIVSSYYEGLVPEMQYNERTTYIAKFIGQLLGWSPMKIDHVIESNLGVFGLLNKSLGREEKDWSLGTKTKVVTDSAYSTDVLNNFYDKAEDYSVKSKSYPDNAEYTYKNKQYSAVKSVVSAINGYAKDDPAVAREFKILARDYVDKFEKNSMVNKKLLDLLEKTGNDDILYDRTFKPTYSINKVEYKMDFEEFMELIDKYYEEVEKEYDEVFEMNLSDESTEKMLIAAKERVYKQVSAEYKVKR